MLVSVLGIFVFKRFALAQLVSILLLASPELLDWRKDYKRRL